jgi:hypothetical protein
MKAYKLQIIGYARRHADDTQRLGLQQKHANTCTHCGADLPSDPDFQALHMQKEHSLIV